MEPIAVEHPAFTYLGITNILVIEVFAPVLDGGKIRTAIRVKEWIPKPVKKKKPRDKPISQRQTNAFVTGGDDAFFLSGRVLRNTSPAEDTPTYFGG